MQAVIAHENHERNRSTTKPMIHVCFSDKFNGPSTSALFRLWTGSSSRTSQHLLLVINMGYIYVWLYIYITIMVFYPRKQRSDLANKTWWYNEDNTEYHGFFLWITYSDSSHVTGMMGF